MRRFKNILFLADGSKGEKAALSRASDLASLNKARLTLFDAIEPEVHLAFAVTAAHDLEAMLAARVQDRERELAALQRTLAAKHPELRIEVEVTTGRRDRAAIYNVIESQRDLLIKARSGDGGTFRRLFGSTDQSLMRKCPCPVWILKPSRRKRFKTIVAAVDLNPSEPETESLATKILALATSLAKDDKSELHVVHVWRLPGEYQLRGRQLYTARVDQLLAELGEAHKRELDELLSHQPYEKRRIHLVKGHADDVIPKIVDEVSADLIVIGTVGRSGVPGLFIGNTAETVLNAVDCAVLTLKPEGFKSPVVPDTSA